jgi:hypothetical protein
VATADSEAAAAQQQPPRRTASADHLPAAEAAAGSAK